MNMVNVRANDFYAAFANDIPHEVPRVERIVMQASPSVSSERYSWAVHTFFILGVVLLVSGLLMSFLGLVSENFFLGVAGSIVTFTSSTLFWLWIKRADAERYSERHR